MANSEVGTSSDVARELRGEYQVFLSFRGPDTRNEFTDFLYQGLEDAGVRVFRDEDELRIGEVIGENILRAIDNSIIYIPIFSPTYASSKWCLRELVRMRHNLSQSKGQKSIFPIFFRVEPDDIKLKTERYTEDFLRHEKEYPMEVQAWREALAKVDEIKGWKVKEEQRQAPIVKLVVNKVLEERKIKQKQVTEHLVGFDDRIKDLTMLLDVKQDDVRLIGIYGMGGIGKTTVAKVIFNKLSSHFGKCCSFLEGVRERSTKEGIVQLQKKLLSDIVCSGSVGKVDDIEEGMRRIGETLGNKMVLVVLDDVNEQDHITNLIGSNSLSSGSRIIITTRNRTALKVEGFKPEILQYEMLKMDDGHALQLFYRYTLGGDFPSGDYRCLSSEIVSHAGGLPLAIRVIGSLLKGKGEEFWKETLVRLRKLPEKKILEKLRISYDDLDEQQQQIFLDIACFFFNESKTDAIYIWNEFSPIRGIDTLKEMCLIKLLDNDKIWMHDQLMDLGRQIIHEESPSELGKQSRLRIAKENLEIMTTQEIKDKVQALQIDGPDDSIEITNEEFERLPNLRFLKLCNGTFVGDFTKCHSKLRWFSWQPPIREFRAKNMYLDRLVVFKLGKNDFTDNSKAWDLVKSARHLKVLSLADCDRITTNPDFSKCSSLERLTLQRCNMLKRIESFIGKLELLIMLEIEWCPCLTNLPEEVGALVKLEHLLLRGCPKLRELPNSLGNLTSLTQLDLSGTGIAELPNSIEGLVKLQSFLLIDTMIKELPNFIGKLKSLRILGLSKDGSCYRDGSYSPQDNVWQLPDGINMLEKLEELDLSKRDEMKGEIPVEIGELSSLRILNLEGTCISGIPSTINKLHHLRTLNLLGCHEIQELPELPTSLTCLRLKSYSLRSFPNLSNLTNLVELGLSDGSHRTKRSNLIAGCNLSWIGRLSRLKKLELNLLNIRVPPELASLSHLEELTLGDLDLKTLGRLPSSLLSLELHFCSIEWLELTTLLFGEVEDIPLDELPQLENLTIYDCKLLEKLSIPKKLRKLRHATVSSCSELDEIRIAGLSESLESFSVYRCESLRTIGGLSYLKNLAKLEIGTCNALTDVEGINELESLKSLKVTVCKSLGMWIDASCANIPNDCLVDILSCGEFINSDWKYPSGICLERYIQEILLDTSNKIKPPFTIDFFLKIKQFSRVIPIKWRKKRDIAPDSVTYEGLIADVKGFGFVLKRIWYKIPSEDGGLLVEIKSDEQVKEMVQLASNRGSIRLIVEGTVDISLEGAIIRASQWGCPVNFLVFLFCVAFFLFLSHSRGKLDFPRKIEQFAGMRRFTLWEDSLVIFVLHLLLFFGVK